MEADMAGIDAILNDETEEATDEVETVEVEAPKDPTPELEASDDVDATETDKPEEQEATQSEDEPQGKFQKKVKPGSDEPGEDWTYSAMKDERQKRQAAEAERDELRKANEATQSQLQQYQQQPAPAFIDPLDDAQGAARQQQEYMQSALTAQRIQTSRMFAEREHGKETVDAAYAAFDASCKIDPATSAIATSLVDHAHPMDEVVSWHKRQTMMSEIGDPVEYRERVKAELLAEMQAEHTSQVPTNDNPQAVPSNFASASNKGNRRGPAWSGPKSIDDLLG